MRPILYEQDEKQFRTNGIGILHDAEECKVTEARNGKFELEMEYPVQGDWATEITKGRFIFTKPNDKDDPHAFRIYEVQSDLEQNKLTVKAVSKTDELSGNVVKPFFAGSKSPRELWDTILQNAVDPVQYRFHSDLVLRTDYQSEEISNVLALLSGEENSITSVYGGEIKRTNDEIFLYRARGREHVTTVRPRKNLKNIKITTNMDGKFTRILPYAKYTPEGENQKEVIVYGDIVKSDHYDDYAQKRIVAVDISNKFKDDKQQLKEQRKERLKEEKENNRAADAQKRRNAEANSSALEEERERLRQQKHEEQRQKRAQARAESVSRRGQSSGRRGKANAAARYAEADAKWEAREQERETKWAQQEENRRARKAASKQARAEKRAAQEAERAARKARQDQIKEETKFVITSAMVSSEALTYFDENPNVDIPNIKIEVDMVPLQDTTAYERAIIKALVDIQLCDTIDVYVPKLDVDITLKVSEIEYDSMRERILKIVATSDGKDSSTLADVQRAEWKDLTRKEIDASVDYFKGSINTIMESANGKNRNFYGPDEPPSDGLKENDMWFKDIGGGETEMYRYDGTQWVLVMPTNFTEMINSQIDDIMTEVSDLFDQYELSTEQLQDELDQVSQDAISAIAESEKTIREELKTAKSKLAEVSNDLNTNKEYISGKITELSQAQLADKNALISKITKDITDLENGIIKRYSNLKIGTNNLIRHSDVMLYNDFSYWPLHPTEKFQLGPRRLNVRVSGTNSELEIFPSENRAILLKPNQEYTLSFYTKADSDANISVNMFSTSSQGFTFSQDGPDGNNLPLDYITNSNWTATPEWKRHWIKFKTPEDIYDRDSLVKYFNAHILKLINANTKVYVSAFQLEESHVLSDWHPNDEDISEVVAEYKNTIDRNLAQLEQTIASSSVGEIKNIRSLIDQTANRVTTAVSEINSIKGVLDTTTSKVDLLPGQINLAVSTAKEESKAYTNAEIQASEGRIVQRVTQNVPGTVESLITSSIVQESGKIRQAITSSMNELGASVRNDTQNIITREVGLVKESLVDVVKKIPKKYGGRNYLSQTDRTQYSGNYTLNSNNYQNIKSYNFVGGRTLKDLGVPKNAKMIIQYRVKFDGNVSNARVMPEFYADNAYLQGFENMEGQDNIRFLNISGRDWVDKVGIATISDDVWSKANHIRFRVDNSSNVQFRVQNCILHTADSPVDWVAAVEDNLYDTGGQNILRNGDFQLNISDSEKFKNDFWNFEHYNGNKGDVVFDFGNHGFGNFKRKGIIHIFGTSKTYHWLNQTVNKLNFKKGDIVTISADVAREGNNFTTWNKGDSLFTFELVSVNSSGQTKGYSHHFKPYEDGLRDMYSNERKLYRVGYSFELEDDAVELRFKLVIFPNRSVNFYFTDLQIEQTKFVNGFKKNPLDIDISNNSKFQEVVSKVDLFTRTIGESENGIPTKIAQMVMDSKQFQTTITSRAAAGTNLILDTETFAGAKTNFKEGMGYMSPIPGLYGKNAFEISIDKKVEATDKWIGVTLPVAISRMNHGETYTIKFKYLIDAAKDVPGESAYSVDFKDEKRGKDHQIMYLRSTDNRDGNSIKIGAWTEFTTTFTINDTLVFDDSDVLPFRVYVYKIGKISISDIMLVRGSTIGEYLPATGISSTIVKQLANSYAIRVLSSGTNLVTEINATPDGVRLKGKTIELDGDAIIKNGIIKKAMIGDGQIGSAQIGEAVINNSHINNVNVRKITGLRAEFENLIATTGVIDNIFTRGIDIGDRTRLRAANGTLYVSGHQGDWNSSSTAATIRTNGRFFGPTWFYNSQTNSDYYTPVMTNAWKNYPLKGNTTGEVNVYGVRGLFLITFKGQADPTTGSSAYLYVNDGSNSAHTYYIPLYLAKNQYNWSNDRFFGG
jgi:phage minor structural protein, N-terminal domain protein